MDGNNSNDKKLINTTGLHSLNRWKWILNVWHEKDPNLTLKNKYNLLKQCKNLQHKLDTKHINTFTYNAVYKSQSRYSGVSVQCSVSGQRILGHGN